MQKKNTYEEGSDPMSLRLGSNSTGTSINRRKTTYTDSCSLCGSKKRRCHVTEEEPRKKLNFVDSLSPKSNVTVKSNTVSPLKLSDIFSIQSPPSLEPLCNPKSPENVNAETTMNPPSQGPYLGRLSSFSDSSPDIQKTPPDSNPATTCPISLVDSIAAPISSMIRETSPKCSEETITTVTKHPFLSPLPSGETEMTNGEIHPDSTTKRSKCARVLWSKKEEQEVVAASDERKMKSVMVASKGEEESPINVQFNCNCGKFYEITIFHE